MSGPARPRWRDGGVGGVNRKPIGPDVFAVGGRRAVTEAVRSGRARRVLVAKGGRKTEGLREMLAEVDARQIPLEWVELESLAELGVRDHQGVVATVTPPQELDDAALAEFDFPPDALVVVLDGITDPQNLGAAARSAEAAGVALLVSRRHRAAPLTSSAVRASAGALLHLPLARVTNLTRTIQALKDRGFFVVGLDQEAPRTIHEEPRPPRPLALVLGSEDTGLSRLVGEACDVLVAVPMRGRTASLNASVALAVGLFGFALAPDR